MLNIIKINRIGAFLDLKPSAVVVAATATPVVDREDIGGVVVEGVGVEAAEAEAAGVDDTPGVGGNDVAGNPAVDEA